jgi:hypothetical protein
VLHTSLRGLAAVWITPLLLVALGAGSLLRVGWHPVPFVLLALGLAMLALALLDFPSRVELDGAGIRRVCLGRTPFVPWERVGTIERSRPSSTAILGNLRSDRREERTVSGGLMARGRARRRWLLTDSVESQEEYDELRELLASLSAPVALRAARPHRGAPPTDVYRRRGRR